MPSEVRLENFWIWTLKKQHIKEIICWVKRGIKKIMEKLNRAQKCSILGPQNLVLRGGRPRDTPGSAPVLKYLHKQTAPDIENSITWVDIVAKGSVVVILAATRTTVAAAQRISSRYGSSNSISLFFFYNQYWWKRM